MNSLITVSYDNNKPDYPAIACFIHKRASREAVEVKAAYVGQEAEELYKIVTQQGYLKELLDKKSGITCKDCTKYGDLHSSCSLARGLKLNEDSPICENFKRKCTN